MTQPKTAFIATHTAPSIKGDLANDAQVLHSFGKVVGDIVDTPQGRYFGALVFSVVFGLFMFVCGYLAATRGATINNRCLGIAVLAKLDPVSWNVPTWCVPLLEELRAPPADSP